VFAQRRHDALYGSFPGEPWTGVRGVRAL